MMRRVFCSKDGRFDLVVTVIAPGPVMRFVLIAMAALAFIARP
jgi:hypothetical protein